MKTVYLNLKTSQGVETVDEFSTDEFTPCERYPSFRRYVRGMIKEYTLAGMYVYESRRCTNYWKTK